MTPGNKSAVNNIPTDLAGLKNEVIVRKGIAADTVTRDPQLRRALCRVVTMADYEAAFNFNARTVTTHFFNAAEQGEIGREEWIRVAHRHGVACLNDAAPDVPTTSNLWNYTTMGFDLGTFSG